MLEFAKYNGRDSEAQCGMLDCQQALKAIPMILHI